MGYKAENTEHSGANHGIAAYWGSQGGKQQGTPTDSATAANRRTAVLGQPNIS
jgi:hypothetical protein